MAGNDHVALFHLDEADALSSAPDATDAGGVHADDLPLSRDQQNLFFVRDLRGPDDDPVPARRAEC
jgi:hypothetical protein